MITAIDSNILLDIFTNAEHADRSSQALRKQLAVGSLVCSGIVWAEVSLCFNRPDELLEPMKILGIDFMPDSLDVAIEAAKAWRAYKAAGGKKERLVADFLIGAHALVGCDYLLTRDRGFFRNYFKHLKVIEP